MSHGDTAETPIENDQRHSGEFLGLSDDKILACRLNHLFGH